MNELVDILIFSGSFAGTVGVVAVSTRYYLKAKIREMNSIKTPFINAQKQSFEKDFLKSVENLKKIAEDHYSQGLKRTSSKIKLIIVSTDELFSRIKKKGTADQLNIASVKYAYLFDKVAYAMDSEHYLDIANNPQLWDNPEQRMKAAENALDSVHQQIIDNVKQVNSSKDLDFKIVLEVLTKTPEEKNLVEHIFTEQKSQKINTKKEVVNK